MPPCNCHQPFPRPEPFSPLPRPGKIPDWGKWIRDRLAEKGALLVFPTRASFPGAGEWPNLYLDLETGAVYRWDRADYAVLVDPREGNDVLVYDSVAAFPDEGEQGKLYIAANTGALYRWGGEGYVALLEGKADKVPGATEGNFAGLDEHGNLTDSGKKPADFATAAQGAKADTAVQPPDLLGFVDGAEYDAEYGDEEKPTILLKHGTTVVATVDATDFVIDGMVSDVKIENGNLVITFNTDSGKQPISIPLTDIFDPANYYDKNAVDKKLGEKRDKTDLVVYENGTVYSEWTVKDGQGNVLEGARVTWNGIWWVVSWNGHGGYQPWGTGSETSISGQFTDNAESFTATRTASPGPVPTSDTLAKESELPVASDTDPVMDGAADPGSSNAFARGDHVHPSDTSKRGLNDFQIPASGNLNYSDWVIYVSCSGSEASEISGNYTYSNGSWVKAGSPITLTYNGSTGIVTVRYNGTEISRGLYRTAISYTTPSGNLGLVSASIEDARALLYQKVSYANNARNSIALANGHIVDQAGIPSTNPAFAMGGDNAPARAFGYVSFALGFNVDASAPGAFGVGNGAKANGDTSIALGFFGRTSHNASFSWQGADDNYQTPSGGEYNDHGAGTFNIFPVGGLAGFWIGEQHMQDLLDAKRDKTDNFTIYGDAAYKTWEVSGGSGDNEAIYSRGTYTYDAESGTWVRDSFRAIRRKAETANTFQLVANPGQPAEGVMAEFDGFGQHSVDMDYAGMQSTGVSIESSDPDTLARNSDVENNANAIEYLRRMFSGQTLPQNPTQNQMAEVVKTIFIQLGGTIQQ